MGTDELLQQSLVALAAAVVVTGVATMSSWKAAATYGFGILVIASVLLPDWEFFDHDFKKYDEAKVNNRFKREEVIINGREGDQVNKASAWLKKYERKLEKKRAKAMEKVQNEVAKVQRKAEEKRTLAEAKWGTKVARMLELANFMRAVGRVPSTKRSFF
ncbi:remorin 4.1-like [Phragmites australis]|uniref:remorin 4.1-like n=1 Tax=Phragmites australis TaxID=29695 RepID=UPI002D7A2E24|nr:remorin 4.1-like [Phragmites australis]